jgi:DNA-binding transcriptional LysR family regulator
MTLDWEKLRLFESVAEAGSFTEAARKLQMSQPALSRQIQALETGLGAKLFHRHARGLALTHEGEQLHELTVEMAERVERTQMAIEASRERPTGEVRLTTSVGFGSTWLARQLEGFIELYPDINVVLLLTDDHLDLARREADVAILFSAPHQADLIQRKLVPVRHRLCAAPAYIERFGEPKSIADLDHHRLIAYGPAPPEMSKNTNWILDIGADGHRRVPVLAINNLYAMLQAVETGAGIAALPSYLLPFSGKLKILLPDVQGPVFQTYFAYPSELRRSLRIAVLRDFITKRMTAYDLDDRRGI